MSTATQSNSALIREAIEKALIWADIDEADMGDLDFDRKQEDLGLALGILHKWREEEAA